MLEVTLQTVVWHRLPYQHGAVGNCVLSLKKCMFSESKKKIKEGPSFRDHCEHFDVDLALPNFFFFVPVLGIEL